MPGFDPWRAQATLYWRIWLASAVWLGLFGIFAFGLGWNSARSYGAAYFPAMAVLVISYSTPRWLRQRAAEARGSWRASVRAWQPYLLWLVAQAGLLLLFVGLGWPIQRSLLVSAYLAAGVLFVGLAADKRYRPERLEAQVREAIRRADESTPTANGPSTSS